MQRFPLARKFSIPDLLVLLLVATTIYGLFAIGQQFHAEYQPLREIHLGASWLAYYTLLSGIRGMVAYLFSLMFTLVVGYAAAKSARAERVIIPLIDIFQSIPVLGFLPAVGLTLIALFPNSSIGMELTAILTIFTSQVWNMTFAFYSSLKSIPHDFSEASTVMGLSWRQRLQSVELPFSAVNLAWNSLLSMAGGWFFLSVCEDFTLGKREFRLPGVGSYMAVAVAENDHAAMLMGVVAMVVLIVTMDFLIWRPILAWVQRFRLDGVPGTPKEEPFMGMVIRESRLIRWVRLKLRRYRFQRRQNQVDRGTVHGGGPLISFPMPKIPDRVLRALGLVLLTVTFVVVAFGTFRLVEVIVSIGVTSWVILIRNVFWTFLRVVCAVTLSTLWAVPAGIWIATNPRRTRIMQPLIQIAASFPAPMLYPMAILLFLKAGIGFDWGSMLLMCLGVQWYVLFNVVAGALRIPQELEYSLRLMKTSRWDTWKALYLPSVFPSLVTGWITAAGGAWNASIVAETIRFGGGWLRTSGIGATIAESSNNDDYRLLAASLAILVTVVVVLNRFVWSKIYTLAETRFRLEF